MEDPPLPGKINMERDLALADEVAAAAAPPALRFYRWSPPALSLGRFQRLEETVDPEICRRLGVDLVRRPTGGRAVLHHRELTYSLAVPDNHPLFPPGVLETYRLISGVIVDAMKHLHIPAELVPGDERSPGNAPGSCFDTASAYELRVAGRKVAGSAQLRRRGVILQHGAILLELSLDIYRQLIRPRHGENPPGRFEDLNCRAAGLHDLGYQVTVDQLTGALVQAFSRAFSVELVRERQPVGAAVSLPGNGG